MASRVPVRRSGVGHSVRASSLLSSSSAAVLLLCASLCLLSSSHVFAQEELTCTNGRLFLSSLADATVHVYDLDGTNPVSVGAFPVAAPAVSLYSTDTTSSRVVGVFGGNTTVAGRVHVFRSGLTFENHGDHMDIVKNAPAKYTFELEGWKPAHITASAGFIGVFYDGVWSSTPGDTVQPSQAQFVTESAFTEDSLSPAPTVTTVPITGGAHHGVAYALDTDAFLVSQPTAARAAFVPAAGSTPDGLKLQTASGTVLLDLDDRSNNDRNCSSLHGSAHVGSDYYFGCSSVGLLSVSYASGGASTSRKLSYPSPVAGKSFRSSTLVAQPMSDVVVANFNDAAGTLVPSYTLAMGSRATAAAASLPLTVDQLIQTNSDSARFCAYGVDKGTPETAGTATIAYLAPDGKLYASLINSTTGVRMEATMSVQVAPAAITCASYTLVSGFGRMFVLDQVGSLLYSVDLEKTLEGEEGAVTSITLPFRPKAGVVTAPKGLDCGASHNHNDGGNSAAAMHDSRIAMAVAIGAAAAMFVRGL